MLFYVTITFHKSLFIYISCVEKTRGNALACDWSAVPLLCVSLVELPFCAVPEDVSASNLTIVEHSWTKC